MTYPGDTYVFTLTLEHPDGTAPAVAVTPSITIVDPISGNNILSPAAAMTPVAGTQQVFAYAWNTSGVAEGTYVALVSYSADGNVFNGKFLERIRLGDTRVRGSVALEATTAKDLTVAKDSTVMHTSDFIPPDNSSLLQQLSIKIANLPPSMPSSADLAAIASQIQDVWDGALGNWVIDNTQGTMTFFRASGNVLRVFQLSKSVNQSSRTRQS